MKSATAGDKGKTDTKSATVKTGWPEHFDYAAKSGVRNSRLGSGDRFKALESKLADRPGVTDPGALAASIGRDKYGGKKMAKLAASGRKRG